VIRHTYRFLTQHPLRSGLTVGGTALCITLMLFLLSIYRGVADGSVEYIRNSGADLWMLQRNATNILRGSSILSTSHGVVLRGVPGVREASPVLLILSSVKHAGRSATLFLAGYDPGSGLGGPPALAEGRAVAGDGDIVLDRSFAARFGYRVGDRVEIQDTTLTVVGLSSGTNAFVIQYAFVTLRRAQALVGFPHLVTCFLIRVSDPGAVPGIAAAIRGELPGVEVYDQQAFLLNNIREMEAGFLPLLYTIAVIGAVVLVVILSLLLSISILERRKDFAVLKAIGSPIGYLPGLVMSQALVIAVSGNAIAIALFFPMIAAIETLAPEISARSSPGQILAVAGAAVALSLLSALFSIRRLRKIYALEAFG
jgi:putative ABC transport system permease protein